MANYPLQALGGPAPTAYTAGTGSTLVTATDDLGPDGFTLGRLYLTETSGNLRRCYLRPAGIEYAGDKLSQGYVPAQLFAPDAVGSPVFGHQVRARQSLKLTIDGNASGEVQCSWSPWRGATTAEQMRAGRSIVAYGQDSEPAELTAGNSVTISIRPDEDGTLGRFVIQDTGSTGILDQLHVTAAYLGGSQIWQGDVPASMFAYNSIAAPWLNVPLYAGEHTISITIKNDHASAAAYPCVGAVVIA